MPSRSRVALSFDPAHEVVAIDGGHFRSTGSDPQFRVQPEGGLGRLTPGWWRLRGRLEATDGAILSPRFYPDYGRGFQESACIPIVGSAEGEVDSVVLLAGSVGRLRFDPTERCADFRVSAMTLEPLSAPEAVARMLAGIARARFGSRRMAASAAASFLRQAVKRSPSQASHDLLRTYIRAHALREGSYDVWHGLFDPLHRQQLEWANAAFASMPTPPEIGLVLDATRFDHEGLQRAVDALLAQTWGAWRLYIFGAVEQQENRLAKLEALDARITVLRGHGGICSVADLLAAPSHHIGILQPGVALARGALCEVAVALGNDPDRGFLYTDSDRIDPTGRRLDPCFRPEWNPHLALEQCYVGPFWVARRDVLEAVADMRVDDGHDAHGLMLRCAEAAGERGIHRVPGVMYHVHDAAVATARTSPHAVREHSARRRVRADVESRADGRLRVMPELPHPPPTVTIIVPTRDRLHLLQTCVESVLDLTDYPDYELLVVDNGSVEAPTLEYLDGLRGRDRCRVLVDASPFNFSALVNAGVRATSRSIVCLLNNDIEVIHSDWLSQLAAHAADGSTGAVGAMLYYPDDTIQHGGVVLGIGGVAGHVHHRLRRGDDGYFGRARTTQTLSAVTAACLAVRRDVFIEVGGFDESLAVAFNDIDFCLRVRRAGYRNVWTPHVELYHHESASRGSEDTAEKRARFLAEVERMKSRWGEVLLVDPAYNPNLSLDGSNFELAFPPRVSPPVFRMGARGRALGLAATETPSFS